MGVECELVEQDWDGIIPALQARRYDAIVASMSITEERKERVDFTDKYYSTPAKFACATGSGIEISEEGLAGKTVGVQRATIHDNFISDNFKRRRRHPCATGPRTRPISTRWPDAWIV
jgi:arginine/ornithine transport system substrate-binding protein